MSINAIEKALWQIGTNPADAEKFRQAPKVYLAPFRLAVGELARRDANTLLLMMAFLAVRGPASMGDYMQSMHGAGGEYGASHTD
jgi:hypothetical protein